MDERCMLLTKSPDLFAMEVLVLVVSLDKRGILLSKSVNFFVKRNVFPFPGDVLVDSICQGLEHFALGCSGVQAGKEDVIHRILLDLIDVNQVGWLA